MNRLRDRQTGQLFGVKYASRTSMWDENVPHSKAPLSKGRADRWYEPVSEVLATSITEEFGYPASSLRVVQTAPESASMGVVTDLVHNSYDGKILSAGHEQLEKADTRKLLHMQVMDVVLANGDRHQGNILFSETSEGLDAVPIDHSFIFQVFDFNDTAEKYANSISVSTLGAELNRRHGSSVDEHAKLVADAGKVLEDVKKIDVDSLEDRLKRQLEETMSDRNLIGQYSLTPEILEQLEELRTNLTKSVQRLREIQGMTPKQLADIIVKPPKPKADSALENIVASVV